MKTIHLFIIIIFLGVDITFCQIKPPYDVRLTFETIEYKNFIILDSSEVWEIGEPAKPFFNSAAKGSKAIMTDTLNPYPINIRDCFYLILDPLNFLWFGGSWCLIEFLHKIDCNESTEGGYVEISYDNGNSWNNIIYDSIYLDIEGWNFYEPLDFYNEFDTLFNGIPAFTGQYVEWRRSALYWATEALKKSYPEIIQIRFCFLSDSLQNNKDGWMIDDIRITSRYSTNVQKNKCSDNIQVIPNPIIDISLIDLSYINTPERIIVYSSTGLKLIDDRLDASEYQISRSDLSPGFYYIRAIAEDEKVYSGSFVVQ